MKGFTKTAIGLLGAVVAAGPASAAPSVYTEIVHSGDYAGETDDEDQPRDNNNQYGAGSEQSTMAYLPNAPGGPTVMVISLGSYTDLASGPPVNRLQTMCATYRLDMTQGLVRRDMKFVTDNRGDRRRNGHRPTVTPIFRGSAAMIEFGYAPNDSNNTEVYVKTISADCNVMSEQVRVLAKNNDNCQARDANNSVVLSDSDTVTRIGSACECNGNGRDDAYAYGLVLEKNPATSEITVDKYFEVTTENEIERHRANIWATSTPDRMFLCGAVGNAQPPNRGARCMLINTAAGVPAEERILWRTYVQKREDRIYAVEPKAAPITDAQGNVTDMFYLMWVEADLTNRDGKEKGKTRVKMSVVRATDAGLDILMPPTYDMTTRSDSSHPGFCGSSFGEDGAARAIMLQGSIVGSTTGVGRAGVINYDAATNKLVLEQEFVYSDSADSAWISKFYGQNPNNQGRNYMHCLGSVPNPGYKVVGGFMPEASQLMLVPSEGRYMRADGTPEDKLSLRINIIGAVVPAAQPPAPPPPPPPGDEPPPPVTPPPPDDGNDGTTEDDPGQAGSPTMFGCAVSHGTSAGGLGGLLLVGLALAATRRRRA
jgi:MYXO-CTERM domain-containing protein